MSQTKAGKNGSNWLPNRLFGSTGWYLSNPCADREWRAQGREDGDFHDDHGVACPRRGSLWLFFSAFACSFLLIPAYSSAHLCLFVSIRVSIPPTRPRTPVPGRPARWTPRVHLLGLAPGSRLHGPENRGDPPGTPNPPVTCDGPTPSGRGTNFPPAIPWVPQPLST